METLPEKEYVSTYIDGPSFFLGVSMISERYLTIFYFSGMNWMRKGNMAREKYRQHPRQGLGTKRLVDDSEAKFSK